MTISQLKTATIPCTVEIVSLAGTDELTERLREMGFFEGARIDVLARLPFGGPWLVRLGATSFALRDLEASCAQVKAV